ncbi:MAG: CotH kinase family protein, partial [Bacteroidales bacterium]|nr:CotH kinase family protein [Bacteroidales bacterium]
FRWVFPDVSLQPGDFLLVWASGKNRTQAGQPLHTNFSISQAGEEVLITRPDGTREDELAPIVIPTDISYGRKPDGSHDWYFFDEPTPGAANTTTGYPGFVDPPEFSIPGGFYSESFLLELSSNDPNATIVYTLDGSEPCLENLSGSVYQYKNDYAFEPGTPLGELLEDHYHSYLYQGAIPVETVFSEDLRLARKTTTVHPPYYFPDAPLPVATVVRARAFSEGMLPGNTVTHSYFLQQHEAHKYSLPVISIAIREDMLFDYHYGIYTPGVDADLWRLNNPNSQYSWPFPGNYRRRGDEVEYPAHLEFFDHVSGNRELAQDVGLRIHGGATRAFPMKSFRIYARNAYGDSYLYYPFFENRPHNTYRRLILRNSGNDFPTSVDPWSTYETMFRDAMIQKIVRHMHVETQSYQPAIVFLNGEYWGILNIRERYDRHFLERVYGVDPENVDILTGFHEAQEGDHEHYLATLHYIEQHGLQDALHYTYINTRIDVENFIDYQIANIFANNTDWPGNNIDFWRLRTSSYQPDSPHGHDGRWRWLVYDTDFGFGLRGGADSYRFNTLAFATENDGPGWPNPPWSTFLLRSFLENQDFRYAFINRFADQLNTGLSAERTSAIIISMKNMIAEEIEDHFARWGYPDHKEIWNENVGVMLDFANNRPFYQRKHLQEYFDLDGTIAVRLDVENQLKGHIRINTIDIVPETAGVDPYPYPWKGMYFRNVPIEVEAVPSPGYVFSHWAGSESSTAPILNLNPEKPVSLKAYFTRTDEEVLMHYWLFDTTLPNDTPLEQLDAFYSILPGHAGIQYISCLEGYPFEPGHPNWRKASMERRNQPTHLNYRSEANNGIPYQNSNIRGLQVRQPFAENDRENTMIIHLPTTGFADVVFRFAAKDEGAADHLIVDYSVEEAADEWLTAGLTDSTLPLHSWYKLYEIDFSDIPGVSDNPFFKIRIRFAGEHMWQDAGNRVTFNNLSLDGVVLNAFQIHAASGRNGQIIPSGTVPVVEFGHQEFVIRAKENHVISGVFVDGKDVTHELTDKVDHATYTFEQVTSDHSIYVSFELSAGFIESRETEVIIYPNPCAGQLSVASLDVIKAIEVSDLTGNRVYFRENIGSTVHDMDLRHLENGLFVVSVRTEKKLTSEKIFIIR